MDGRQVLELLAAQEAAAGDGLYDRLLGSWNVEATWFEAGAAVRTAKGQWHFARILGGRGVQDVLFAEGTAPDRYGTTLRCHDAQAGAWHVFWAQPAQGEFARLLGRSEGADIVQVSTGGPRLERWCFREITEASFLWTGEASEDGGRSWVLEQTMRAARA